MRLNVCFNEMALFGPFAALIKGCSSYDRRWLTRKEWKCSPLRDLGFLKISCIFLLCVECNRRHLYLLRICRLFGVRYSGRHRGRNCAWGSRSSELSAQVVGADSCKSCIPAHTDASISRPGRNGWECVEDGRGRRPRALVVCMWTKAYLSQPDTSHSRYTKPPSSRNCKQHRMWKLRTHGRWN